MKNPIYLDYNATTPIDSTVVKAMLPFFNEHFGNPSSSHIYGKSATLNIPPFLKLCSICKSDLASR